MLSRVASSACLCTNCFTCLATHSSVNKMLNLFLNVQCEHGQSRWCVAFLHLYDTPVQAACHFCGRVQGKEHSNGVVGVVIFKWRGFIGRGIIKRGLGKPA